MKAPAKIQYTAQPFEADPDRKESFATFAEACEYIVNERNEDIKMFKDAEDWYNREGFKKTFIYEPNGDEPIQVKTSESSTSHIEIHYAYEGEFGVETTTKVEELPYLDHPVKCEVVVGEMFPGTQDEWNRHIFNCIIEALDERGMLYVNSLGEKSMKS